MRYTFSITFFGIISILSGCDNDQVVDQIPYKPFNDISINLTGQQYLPLKSVGYVTIDGGVKGIVLYKNPFKEEYFAYERNCSFEPTASCARIEIDDSGLFMIDPCCASQFSFESGYPIAGPASYPLRRYKTYLDGNFLTITDEPLQ